MKTSLLLAGAAVLLVNGACSTEHVSDKHSQVPAEVPNVVIQRVSRSSIEDHYEATGTVKAKTTTQVSANIMGRITSMAAAEGDTVTRGQVIVEIDNSEARTQLDKARAALTEAEAALVEVARSAEVATATVRTAEVNRQMAETTYGRYKELYDRRSVSAQEFDEAESRLKAASSELERARANVQATLSRNKQINARIQQAKAEIASTRVHEGYSRITAPVTGIVVKKFTEPGSMATPGTPLLSIEDSSGYRLEAAVEESRSKQIRVGNRVSVKIEALGDGEFAGTVGEILPTADAASRSYTVKINLPAGPGLRTGLYGLARFPLARKDAITVPQPAIVKRGQLTGVYVVGSGGTVQFRIITAGAESEGMVEVLTGLSEGDEVAVSETERLSDGSKVR